MKNANPAELKTTTEFLKRHFGVEFAPGKVGREEEGLVAAVLTFVSNKFAQSRYPLGLALDIALLAQHLSRHDPEAKPYRKGLTKEQIFDRYSRITARGDTVANTLTLTYRSGAELHEVGIRKLEEDVIDLFLALRRPGYPSSYAYVTGQWQKYQDALLVPAFQLSESGRFRLCQELINFGLANLTKSRPLGRKNPRVRLFEWIVRNYSRARQRGERAGSVFQGIAAGYMKADRPHLYLIVDKTRTGSARQDRLGDIDGYTGMDLEISVEVKDIPLTGRNVTAEVGEFLNKLVDNRVMGLVFARSADSEAIEVVREHGAVVLTQDGLLAEVERWDWRKQEAAVAGLIHFLAHVEQNPDAVARLLKFIAASDPGHESLVYLED